MSQMPKGNRYSVTVSSAVHKRLLAIQRDMQAGQDGHVSMNDAISAACDSYDQREEE